MISGFSNSSSLERASFLNKETSTDPFESKNQFAAIDESLLTNKLTKVSDEDINSQLRLSRDVLMWRSRKIILQ
jgi:hypothetical protein